MGKKDESVLENEIYETIKRAILNRRVIPGTKLSEGALAKSLNVSRTPIRSALRRLSYDRLVKIIPRQGAFVVKPTIKEVKDVFEMRILIEEFAVKKACENFDEYAYERMQKIIEEEKRAYANKNMSGILTQVQNIHIEIAKLSNNEILISQLQELTSLTNIYLAFYSEMKLNAPDSPREHKNILEEIKNKDINKSQLLMREHINAIISRLNFQMMEDSSVDIEKVFSS